MTWCKSLAKTRELKRLGTRSGTTAQRLYRLYLFGLVTVIIGIPATMWGHMIAAQWAQQMSWTHESLVECGAKGVVPATILAFWIGRLRGPIIGSPHLISVLGASPLPRRATLLGFYASSALAITAVVLAVTLLAVLSFPHAQGDASLAVVVFSVSASAVISLGWLAGLVITHRWVYIALMFVLVSAGTVILRSSVTTDFFSTAVYNNTAVPVAFAALGCTIAVVVVSTRALLDRAQLSRIIQQNLVWGTAVMLSHTGDVMGGAATLVPPPRSGRQWRIPRSLRWVGVSVWLDLMSVGRRPALSLLALCFTVTSGLLAIRLPQSNSEAIAALTGVMSYLALTLLSPGLLHAVLALKPPRLWGQNGYRTIVPHGIVPTVLVLATVLCTFLGAALSGLPVTAREVFVVSAVVLFALPLRTYVGLKRQPPSAVLTPTITPLGDASAVFLLVWQLDFVILSAGWSVLMATGAHQGWDGGVLGGAVAMTLWVMWGIRRRFQRL